jgi:hypothetical protein
LALISIVCCVNPVRAQSPTPETTINNEDTNSSSILEKPDDSNLAEAPSNKSLWWESAKVDLKKLPGRIVEDSKYTFLRADNMTALLLAGGASIAMHQSRADKNIAENFERHQVFRGFIDESLNIIGSPATHFPVTALFYAIAAENQDEFNKERAWSMMTALSMTGLVTVGLKAIRDNDAPNNAAWAWPSGHTASSFTVASVLDEFYGLKVGIPAYIMASLVAYRMMDAGDHWASDCVFGATLGWVVGHSIAGRQKQLEIAGFDVLPYIGTNGDTVTGVSLVKQF